MVYSGLIISTYDKPICDKPTMYDEYVSIRTYPRSYHDDNDDILL